MRLGRERPRKVLLLGGDRRHIRRFNEAGARTPQKGRKTPRTAPLPPRASMRLGRERPRKGARRVRSATTTGCFNEAGARTPQKAGVAVINCGKALLLQ